jgi:hypothetical protein
MLCVRAPPQDFLSSGVCQLPLKPINVCDVRGLRLYEEGEQLSCFGRAVAVAFQLRDDFALPGYVLLTESNVTFGLQKVLL